MKTYNLGDLVIVKGTTNNPYVTGGISGPDRARVINSLKEQKTVSDDYEFWIAPTNGGAFKVQQHLISFQNPIVLQIHAQNPQ
jgi:hypothetical protein